MVAAAFVLRLAWLLFAGGVPPRGWINSGDQHSYFHYGQEIAAGRGYVSYTTGDATAYYPIGYPALLGVIFWTVQHTPLPDDLPLAAGMLNVALGTATVLLVFVVGRAVVGSRRALIAAALTATFPNLIFYTATFALETAFVFFALLALALVSTCEWTRGGLSRWRLVGFGVALGASALVRPFSLVLLGGVGVALFLAGGWRTALRSAAFVIVPLALVLTPWTVRNAARMDAFVPFSTNLGDTACLDRSPDSTGGFRWADHEWCAPPELPEVERNRRSLRLALRFVREHPGTELRLIGRRFLDMMEHDHSGLAEAEANHRSALMSAGSRRILAFVADAYFFMVGLTAVAGLFFLFRRWRARPTRAVVAAAILGLFAIPLALWGNPRFHVPTLPLLAIVAAAVGDRHGSQPRPEPGSDRVTVRLEPGGSGEHTKEAAWRAE